ncbi:heavy-metal-associated domain-containing protein [Terrimonas sp. NA20]|uniref:Heavy-metal-associated domain-containing protein n=1 Tax=Terrimonas ginsenosidimutans TaxID=2908004 RepID=A0ABS9KYQ5_9BACT|nr:heavy-metal-associated domain-containing protein [Terrimonas ginsenosidimutans]MCG2617357.1 heavy-metal-associated domain-containing protein [Terrimonas ginsenosidimutans]
MKKLLLTCLVALGFASASFAQVKPSQTAKIKTPNILCEDCKKRVTTYLDRIDGVQTVAINTRRGETTVKFVSDRTNIEEIKTAIANSGFDADDIPANEESYKRLPKTCKKFEDGGGHPKPKAPAPAEQ